MVAPTPVSALLHAVAVVKAGVFTIMKVAVYVFGIELVSTLDAAYWLSLLAGFTTIRDLGTEGAAFADVALRDAIAGAERLEHPRPRPGVEPAVEHRGAFASPAKQRARISGARKSCIRSVTRYPAMPN